MTPTEWVNYRSFTDEAMAARASMQLADSEEAWRKVLAILETTCGPQHPYTAAVLTNIAYILDVQGRELDAEALFRQALQIRNYALGPNHPSTAISLFNLAVQIDSQGRAKEAEPLFRRALAIDEMMFPLEEQTITLRVAALAANLDQQKRYSEAEQLHRRALANAEIIGLDLPITATTLNGLANNLRAQRRYAEAEPLLRRALAIFEALEIFETVPGREHPYTAAILNNLAGTLLKLGRTDDAALLSRRAMALYKKNHDDNRHPNVINGNMWLALTRLSWPDLNSAALFPARDALTALRSRYADLDAGGIRGERQQERNFERIQRAERLFADAAWARGAAFPSEAPGLRVESFGALQSAGSGPAARAIAETAARRYAVEAGAGQLVSERARQVELWAAAERRNIAAQAQSGGQDRAAREA
ncbi:tetratricopeptide repeat protein, partial [Erythrobacter donghaensis]|uniref:tetratricopeptide repeat protein n=1 Tax=Erythrobacter donghaensis TaxID=267135 RepID=UPI0018C549EA